MRAYLAAASCTSFGRRRESLLSLAREAGAQALEGRSDVDRLFVSCQAPEPFADTGNLAVALATELGLSGIPASRIETGPSSGSAAIEAAMFAVASGSSKSSLVVGVEKMSSLATPKASAHLSRMIHPSERRYGCTMPALAALTTRRWMHETGCTREQLAQAPVKAHAHARRNPRAQFRNSVTTQEVLSSPEVADPLRVLDCAPMSDGAAAVLIVGRRGPVRVLGIGHGTDDWSLAGRQYDPALTSFRATRLAARRCEATARRRTRDADVVEMHDAFSVLELLNPVDLGLVRRETALPKLLSGDTSLGGSLPINVSGGLKARGHPVGATGVAQAAELYWQLSGEAGSYQVDGASIGLLHNIGGYGNNVLVAMMGAVR